MAPGGSARQELFLSRQVGGRSILGKCKWCTADSWDKVHSQDVNQVGKRSTCCLESLADSSEGVSLLCLLCATSPHPPFFFQKNQIWVFLSSFLKNLISMLPITCLFYTALWRGRLSFPPKSSVFLVVLMLYIGTAELLCLGRHSGLNSLLCFRCWVYFNSATFPGLTQAHAPWWLRDCLLCLLMDSPSQRRIPE